MVEWSITPVLKTGVLRGTGGSNPSLSALIKEMEVQKSFLFLFHNYSAFILSDAFGQIVRNVRTVSPPRTDSESEYCVLIVSLLIWLFSFPGIPVASVLNDS